MKRFKNWLDFFARGSTVGLNVVLVYFLVRTGLFDGDYTWIGEPNNTVWVIEVVLLSLIGILNSVYSIKFFVSKLP